MSIETQEQAQKPVTLETLGYLKAELEPKPAEYALVELKGFNQLCGKIYEVEKFGFTFGCVEIRDDGEIKAVLFGASSVYRITPYTEQEVEEWYNPPRRTFPPTRPYCDASCIHDDEYDDSDPFADDGPDYHNYFDASCKSPDPNTLVDTFIFEDGAYNFAGRGYIPFEDERVEDESGETGWNCTHWRNIDPKTQAVFDRNDDSRR